MFEIARRPLARSAATVGIALAQLRRTPMRTVLTVVAIALAVLAVTLFASAGLGVLETGQEGFEEADRDLWITGGGLELTPSGFENPIVDAHEVVETTEAHDGVRSAAPIAFQAVYVDADGEGRDGGEREGSGGEHEHEEGDEDAELVTGVGVPATHDGLSPEAGEGLSGDDATDEIVVDRQTADALGVEVGDTVTVAASRAGDGRERTVVGIASAYSDLLGTATVTLPLTDLQALAGTTGSDRAAFVTVTVEDDADLETVRDDLDAQYPEYEVRTNREQFEAMLESRVLVVASAATLVGLAVVVGSALTLNTLVLSVVHRRAELSALYALGLSRGTLVGIVVVRSVVLGVLGGIVGLAATPAIAAAGNAVVAGVLGFPDLLTLTWQVYALGAIVALAIGTLGSLAVGWYLSATVRVRT